MDEPQLKIAGNAVVDTSQLVTLAAHAVDRKFEYQIPVDLIGQLDWNGKHILCIRPHLMEEADLSEVDDEGLGRTKFDTTWGTALPCEVMMKLQGQKTAVKRMLSVMVKDYADLEQIWDGPTPAPVFRPVDGESRRG
ncbi:MAG TPA: hypothetical protein VFI41_05205 [Gemmatimonadales bacterium]|nr:hypothetical protein [Gemmatimonadales bacterium]